MDPTFLISSAVVLFGLTLVFATLLGIAKEKLKVEEDPRIPEVIDVLPAANCGGCGFAGCADFAKAVVEERAEVSGCPVGGASCAENIASILGVEVVKTLAAAADVLVESFRTGSMLKRGLDYEQIRSGLAEGYPRAADLPRAGFAAGPCLFKDTM